MLGRLLAIAGIVACSHTALAYPAYEHSHSLPHRSVILFAPDQDTSTTCAGR